MDVPTIAGLSLPVVFILFMGVEAFMPSGRSMPPVRHWRLIGFAALIVTLAVNALFPLLVIPYLPTMTLVDLGRWGLWAAVPTVVLTTFLTYWTHRIQHRFDLLWRMGHQLHHGVARVDIASAMIFHPVDVIVQVMMTLVAAGLLNITPEAGAVAGVSGFLIALYQHWNVRTPAWTGWFIQRPEAHLLHHERDVHARNFGDMPVWDRLFGTYAEPREGPVELGFAEGRGRRWLAMVAMVDVNRTEGRLRL
ncbi:MAG TPA: sterol desaturase family protein [Allosphingosinicella sp.]|jgi:sterol desaturase/sphingolipid hydroxylase (fatty acid hydroxylase superfamily)|nr:sterol desaturase family protein [Allosphingosinicella sp.]